MLRMIKALDHQAVYWRYYSNRSSIMQCKNCQRFGHGGANCFKPPKCIKCAEHHVSSECPVAKGSTDGLIPTHKLKCANCGGNHTANYFGYPERQNKTSKENSKAKAPIPKQVQISSTRDFPHLPSAKPLHNRLPTHALRTHKPQTNTYANIAASNESDLFGPECLSRGKCGFQE